MQNAYQDHQPYKLTWLDHLPVPDIQILDLSCQQFPLDWGICYFYASDGRFYEVNALGVSFPMYLLGYQPNVFSFTVQMSDLFPGRWKFYLNLGDRILQKDYRYEASWTGLVSSTYIATPEFRFQLECRTGKYDLTQTAAFATTLIDGIYWVVSAKWGGGEVSQPIHTAKIYAGALVVSKNDELLYVFNTQTKLINAIRLVASPNSDAIGIITVFGSNRPFNCLDGVHMLLYNSDTMVVAYTDATIESTRIERVALPALLQPSVRSLGLACRLSFEPASHIERGLYVFLEHEQPWIRTLPFTVLLKCGGVALGDMLMTRAIDVPNRNTDRQVLIRPTADGEIWCSYTIEGDAEFDSALPQSTISAHITETYIQIEEDVRRREFRVGSSVLADI